MLGDEDQAKDIVQETMVTIWQKLKKIKTAEVYKTWIYRIVVNKCYDEMRKKKRAQSKKQFLFYPILKACLMMKYLKLPV